LWFSEQCYCSARALTRDACTSTWLRYDSPRQHLELCLQRITASPRSLCLATSFGILLSHLQSYTNGVRWVRHFKTLSCVYYKLH
jgi:hypothetical protein